jgi:5-methylcytosine-specific restriction enzyme subunit McrC
MTNAVRVREHGELPVEGAQGLKLAELDFLGVLRDGAGKPFFTEHRRGHGWCARFAHYVGAIGMPGGRTLEILPKIADLEDPVPIRRHLMRMLAETDQLPAVQGELDQYAASDHLIDAYLRLAADRAWRLLRAGVPRDYRKEDLRTPFIRGKWLVGRQMARSPLRYDRHEVRPDLFTVDTQRNRLLKAGLSGMARVARRHETVRLLRGVVALLGPVSDVAMDGSFLRRLASLSFDRRNERWRPLFRIIEQFTKALPSDVAAGRASFGPAWLFDMNKLFQSYIAKRLRRIAGPPEIREGATRAMAFEVSTCKNRFRLNPDIVVGRRDQPLIVIDAKWKRLDSENLADSVGDEDMRQVFAYAKIFRTQRAALVFPAAGPTPRRASFRTRENVGFFVDIDVVEVPMRDDQLLELDQCLGHLLRGALLASELG